MTANAGGLQIPPVGNHGAGHLIRTIEARGEPTGAEGCGLANVQRLLAVGVVDSFREVLRGKPQHHLGGRATFLAGVEHKAGIGRGDKCGTLELLAVELPIHPSNAFREIKPATVAAEGSGNLAADVQNRAGDVVRTVGDVAEFAPSTAIDIVRRAEISSV